MQADEAHRTILTDVTECPEPDVLISVIVPVYNTGKYLQEAIESVLQQGVQRMEVICVNDGSTDDSLTILEQLAQKDNRIRILSQQNQGQSVARNTAMRVARGKYIYFMDSDDVLKPNCFKTCLTSMEEGGYDFVFFDGEVFCEEGTPNLCWNYSRTDIYEENTAHNGMELMHSLLDNYTHRAVPWLLFIRHEQIKRWGLSFYPGIIHEDELYTTLLTLQSGKIGCLKQSFVKHRVRANSTMTHRYSRRNVDCYLTVVDELMRWAKGEEVKTINQPSTTAEQPSMTAKQPNTTAEQPSTTAEQLQQREAIIRKYARYTLDKVFVTAQVLPLRQKISLTRLMIQRKYINFVSAKNWMRFLLK